MCLDELWSDSITRYELIIGRAMIDEMVNWNVTQAYLDKAHTKAVISSPGYTV